MYYNNMLTNRVKEKTSMTIISNVFDCHLQGYKDNGVSTRNVGEKAKRERKKK